MEIRYGQNFINGILGIGGFNLVLGLASLATATPAWFLLIVGALLLALAFVLRGRPLLTIEQDRVIVHGLIGRLTRVYPIHSQDDIVLEGNRLYVKQAGYAQRLPVAKGMINSEDWAELKVRYGQTSE